jgi:putative aldouronate transport system substrate-binding protein
VIYTHGFDSYAFTYPGIKDGVRVLNDWYNNGLVWQDFHLHGGRGDTREEDNMKNGFVGSMIHNWDWPYRFDSNGVQGMMRQILNDESVGYIAVNTFENDAGIFRKIIPANNDRKIAFPRSNPEPEASLLYLDYVSRLDVRSYLNAGELGINFEILPDGAVRGLDPTSERVRDNIFVADFTTPEGKTEWTWAELIMNSPRNIDYLMTFNTESNVFFESEEIFQRSRALSYPEAPPEAIERAARYTFYGGRVKLPIQAGTISAEAGMGSTLVDKRDQTLVNAVRTSPDNFDNIFDSGMADYLNSGGQAIIDERTRAWEDLYGDVENCTCNDNPETCGIHAT